MNLYMCEIGKIYKVTKITAPSNIKDIIYSLRIVPDTKIKKVFKNIFNTLTAYEIATEIIALNDEYAKYIEVSLFEK